MSALKTEIFILRINYCISQNHNEHNTIIVWFDWSTDIAKNSRALPLSTLAWLLPQFLSSDCNFLFCKIGNFSISKKKKFSFQFAHAHEFHKEELFISIISRKKQMKREREGNFTFWNWTNSQLSWFSYREERWKTSH